LLGYEDYMTICIHNSIFITLWQQCANIPTSHKQVHHLHRNSALML